MGSSRKNDKISFTDYIIGFLLILAAGIVPVVCRLTQVPVSTIENQMLRSATVINDVFSYNKSVFICIIAVVLIIMFMLEIMTETSSRRFNFKKPEFILMGVYALLAVVSAVFSAYKPVSFSGISERYEGLWVLLSYVVLFLSVQLFANNKRNLNFVLVGFFLSALLVGGIGMFQYFGMDIFKTEFGLKMIVSEKFSQVKALNIKFTDIYSTLYNPNCVGLYSAMLTPFFLSLALFIPIKNYFKYISAVFTVIMAINVVGSASAGGMIGFAAALGVIAIVFVADMFYNKRYKAKPVLYWSVFGVGVCGIIMGVVLLTVNTSLNTKINSAVDSALNLSGKTEYIYKDLKVEDNKALISTEKGTITLAYNDEIKDVELYGINGEIIESSSVQNISGTENGKMHSYDFVDGPDASCQVQYTKDAIAFTDGSMTFLFKAQEDGSLVALSKKQQPVSAEEDVKAMVFDNNIYFASGRGYIWSRSIPVALKHIFIGSGPDTFSFEFPQNDVFGKVKVLGSPYIIVDKPHSIYLQSAINTGGISLIALLAVFLYYIYRSFKSILRNNSSGYIFAVKIAALAGVCGYLVAGLATDSVVSVAPVFWILLGTGYAVNEL